MSKVGYNNYQSDVLERTNKALEKAKAQLNKQENICVLIPSTAFAQGYTIICDASTAQSKYKDFKQFPLNPKPKKNAKRKIPNA